MEIDDTGGVNTPKTIPTYMWKTGKQGRGSKLAVTVLILAAGCLLLITGFIIGRLSSAIPHEKTGTTTSPMSAIVPTADLRMPALDVPGDDIPGLPPFPGMRRVEYRQVIIGDLLETEVEYVMEGSLEPIHDYFRQLFDAEGWNVADLHIFQGEWTFFIIQGEREALVELESRGPLVEVEIELKEPIAPGMAGVINPVTEP